MLRKYIPVLGVLMMSATPLFAATDHEMKNHTHTPVAGKVHGMVSENENMPVIGANVYWKGTQTGVVTDDKGAFLIPVIPETRTLVISYIGYAPQEIEVGNPNACQQVRLGGNVALDEVVVTPPPSGTMHMKLTPLNSQKITAHELGRAACCNLSESFETNPSVDVSYTDAATGAKQIQLLGLSGKYVQMLTEQAPAFTGAASLYGLSYVPGPWMESIQVSKGTSSVKNGYDALSGQINVEYKKPQTAAPLSLNLFAADNGRVEVNADANRKLTENLATGILLHYSREMKAHDGNDDGFTDLPRTQQLNLMNRWYYKKDGFISQTVANVLAEQRKSGQFSHKGEEIHDPYQIDINTRRANVYTKNGYVFGDESNTSVAMILSGTYHNQESAYGKRDYNVVQKNLYASLLFEQEYNHKHNLSAGLSLNVDDYNENVDAATAAMLGNYQTNRTDVIPGVYGQYTLNLDHKLIVQAGLRADYHSRYGAFVTPRLHVKYQITPWLAARLSAGKGYRISNLLAENSFLLASSRRLNIAENTDLLESAWNYGTALSSTIPLFGKELQLNLEWYYTNFNNQVVADMDTDAHAVTLKNNAGQSYASIYQIEATYPFFEGFTLTGAFRYTDAKTNYNGELRERYLTSRYKGMLSASYFTKLKKWQFDLTAQFNGPGRMPDADVSNPLWENTYPAFTGLNAQITKNFRRWSIYLGGENLLNYKQKNPIIAAGDPWGNNFDATMVWGPVHGRKLYGGIRFNL